MKSYKEQMCEYVDACMEYNLPINTITWFMYKVSNTPWIYTSVVKLIKRGWL